MEILKSLYDLLRETYGPFLPASKAKRQAFLAKTREKVIQYKPKIEERFAVNMGEIHVKDFKYYLREYTKDQLQEEYQKYAEKVGREPSGFTKGILAFPTLTGITIGRPLCWLIMSLSGGMMKHYNSTLYVPFYYINQFNDMDFKNRERRLDQTVVHELSHKLWYSLGGNESSERNWRLWNEGFAGYCAEVYFADLYPEDFEAEQTRGFGVHAKGKQKVEELVESHGKQILL